MDVRDDFYIEILQRFQQMKKDPTYFLEVNENLVCDIKDDLKSIYDYMKSEEIKLAKSNALSKLVVQDFDLEQIWQQIELQNESLLTRSLTTVTKLIVAKRRLLFKSLENESRDELSEEEEAEQEEEEKKNNNIELETANEVSSMNEESFSDSDVSDKHSKNNESTKSAKRSIVDDEFFKLHEMEQFLHTEEKKTNDPDSGNDSDESESNVSVDLFKGDSDDDEDLVKTAKYKDFFVSKENLKKKEPRNKFLEEIEEDDEKQPPQSSFEMRQGRLSKKIEEIEKESVREKPWQLKGEITSEDRPQNSLLEEIVEFDLTTKPAPVITEQTTMQLEDIIKQRIKDKVFDSVERKSRPTETPLEYKKKLVLEQEKSKESLAQIYEREFLEQQAALDTENTENTVKEPELHLEINSMMTSLFTKLEALSNFHFTPRPATVELKIVSNLPAISMEEVTPAAVSEAALLAPEEVKNKRDIVGRSERTTTDKKRERKRKKLKQKMRAAEKQKKEEMRNQTPGLRNKFNKEKMKNILEKVTKEKHVDKMVESFAGKSVKSSKAFFTQLEEEVKTQIKRKATEIPNKKKYNLNAKKLKL